MSPFVKGTLATGTAIVLLLGGAGTFALWNDSAQIANSTGGQIDPGHLYLLPESATNGRWYDVTEVAGIQAHLDDYAFLEAATRDAKASPHNAVPVTGLESEGMVPGDVFVYVGNISYFAKGKHLTGQLRVTMDDAVSITGPATDPLTQKAALAELEKEISAKALWGSSDVDASGVLTVDGKGTGGKFDHSLPYAVVVSFNQGTPGSSPIYSDPVDNGNSNGPDYMVTLDSTIDVSLTQCTVNGCPN